MDSLYNSSTKKIPYDDTPIYRRSSQNNKQLKSGKKIKIFSIFFAILFVLNISLCITCFTYLKNGKIKIVNIYNDKFSTQEVTYLVDSMRSAKYNSVCVAAGLSQNGISILPTDSLTNDQFFKNTKSHGAGFLYKIIGDSAYFVTCFHVINYNENEASVSSTRIWVLPASMLVPIEVELVSYSAKEDVAVLKYTHSNILETLEGTIPVEVYDSTFVTEYEDVFTIGNPLNYGFNGTSGKLTAFRQELTVSGVRYSWMKTDTAINPGNSGGGLFDSKGRLIGMVNANIPETASGDPVSNIAYAIPGTLVCSIADNIIENNLNLSSPKAVDLGINFAFDEIMGIERHKATYKDPNGEYKDVDQNFVIVSSFGSDSLAKKQGVKVGDRIVSMEIEMIGRDGTIVVPILDKFTFYEYAYAIKPSSFITLNIQRQNTQNETIDVQIIVRAIKTS